MNSRWLRLTGWSAQRTLRVLQVSLARPVTWIDQAQRDRDGRLWLELSELDIADWATVVSIDECPAEIEGEGRLVTGRFEHSSAEVLNLYVEGEPDPIGITASHPFWSQDRQAFVSAELLRTTERLRLEDGRTAAVTRIEQLRGSQSVYNLEVDGEHVYHVGLNGVLVHNMCAPKGAGLLEIPTKGLQKVFDKHGAHFGLSGNWNPSRAADVLNAIKNHMGAAGTKIVDGTYRGQSVFHHVDSATGLNVITDLNGKFIGGWKLGLEQLESVLTTGRLF